MSNQTTKCCDDNCEQGKYCPCRLGYAVRKCRAGQPVNDDLHIEYAEGYEDDAPSFVGAALTVFVLSILASIGIVVMMALK